MALRLAAARATAVAKTHGFRSLSSFSSFIPPASNLDPKPTPKADPSENLFVVGLSKRTTSDTLRECFAKFGEVVNARVVTDRVNGYSKGFGFVRYATVKEAAAALKGMDGQSMPDHRLLLPPRITRLFKMVVNDFVQLAAVRYGEFAACTGPQIFSHPNV